MAGLAAPSPDSQARSRINQVQEAFDGAQLVMLACLV